MKAVKSPSRQISLGRKSDSTAQPGPNFFERRENHNPRARIGEETRLSNIQVFLSNIPICSSYTKLLPRLPGDREIHFSTQLASELAFFLTFHPRLEAPK